MNAHHKRIALEAIAFAIAIATAIAVAAFALSDGGGRGPEKNVGTAKLDPAPTSPAPATTSPSPPLPPRTRDQGSAEPASWQALVDTLVPLAERGDRQAAAALFEATKRCERASLARKIGMVEMNATVGLRDPERMADADATMAGAAAELRSSDALCNGTSDEALGSRVYDILLIEAELGDPAAAICYASGGYEMTKSIRTPAAVARYRDNAMRLLDREFRKGNWQSVAVLAVAYSNVKRRGLFGQLTELDWKQAYAYQKLESLGASPEIRTTPGHLGSEPSGEGLSPEDVQAGDEWARDAYARYFRNSGPSGANPSCDG